MFGGASGRAVGGGRLRERGLNVPGDLNVNLSIYGLAMSGAVDAADNGAGILFESGNGHLTISNSWFYGNQDGVLVGTTTAASLTGMTVSIDHSEFSNNGVAPSNPRYGFDHNLYVNGVDELTVTDSYFHDALGGHEIKSRALKTTIQNNRILDGPTSDTSYSIDLPNGGIGMISGNVIEKGAAAPNKYFIHFAGEGTYPASSLEVSGNIFVNDRPAGSTGVYNQSKDGDGKNIPATIKDNTLYKVGEPNLFQDNFGPPLDIVSGNLFPAGDGPVLDTSHPFNFALAVPEPATAALLPLALLATTLVRRWRKRSRGG